MTQGAINSTQAPPRHQPDPSSIDEELFDRDTLDKIKLLEQAKTKAAAEENFDEALALKATLERIRSVGVHLQELNERKMLAIQSEDYDAAKIIKMEIQKLQAAAFPPGMLDKYLVSNKQEQQFNQGYN